MHKGAMNDPSTIVPLLITTIVFCLESNEVGPLFAVRGASGAAGLRARCACGHEAPEAGEPGVGYRGAVLWACGGDAPASLEQGLARAEVMVKCGGCRSAVSCARARAWDWGEGQGKGGGGDGWIVLCLLRTG